MFRENGWLITTLLRTWFVYDFAFFRRRCRRRLLLIVVNKLIIKSWNLPKLAQYGFRIKTVFPEFSMLKKKSWFYQKNFKLFANTFFTEYNIIRVSWCINKQIEEEKKTKTTTIYCLFQHKIYLVFKPNFGIKFHIFKLFTFIQNVK